MEEAPHVDLGAEGDVHRQTQVVEEQDRRRDEKEAARIAAVAVASASASASAVAAVAVAEEAAAALRISVEARQVLNASQDDIHSGWQAVLLLGYPRLSVSQPDLVPLFQVE